jgi:hypothetical protein
MRRLAQILGLLAALGGSLALGGCPLFHGDYPPANGECTTSDDCFLYETCSDAGVCVEQVDGGQP